MRPLISAFLTSVILANFIYHPVRADGAVFGDDLSLDYLGVRYHHVTVTIDDTHAVTRVEQEFYNPFNQDVKGQYLFPIFPGSELTRFQVILDNVSQSAIRQDAATTNSFLYTLVAGRRDPSLLHYIDWETLAFELTVPAGGSRRMVLEYEQVLPPSGGMYRYHYVLSTERYTSRPLDEVSLTVKVSLSSGLASLYSPSHAVTVERLNNNQATASWQAQDVQPLEDFDLFYAPTESGFGGGLLTGERADQGHFMFLFSPEGQLAQDNFLPKDVVFVVDRSGSMNGEKIEQARNALRYFVDQLDEADRFSIVAFDERIMPLSTKLLTLNQQTLEDARRYVDSLTAGGSTDINAALQEGLAILERSERRESAARLIVFITDGIATAGVIDDTAIVSNATERNRRIEARLHAFGVGYDVNTHLLDQLAAENGGSVTYVQPDENLEQVLTDFYDRVAHPVLTNVEIQFEGMTVSDVYPQNFGDLFDGSGLILTGRYTAWSPTVAVRVQGQAGAERREYIYNFDLDETGDYDFVPRLWATRRVGELLDRVRVEGQNSELIQEIQELGLGYGVVTPYTDFVIAAQLEGAASASNMRLYDDVLALNSASGQVTILARVQNQAYQSATQANLAAGTNIYNQQHHSLAQLSQVSGGPVNIDLSLLQGQDNLANEPITVEWIEQNLGIDRVVEFGSDEYFQLASDPDIRPFLQSGANVIFAFDGQIIRVIDDEAESVQAEAQWAADDETAPQTTQPISKPWWQTAPWWVYGLVIVFMLWLAQLPLLAKIIKKQ